MSTDDSAQCPECLCSVPEARRGDLEQRRTSRAAAGRSAKPLKDLALQACTDFDVIRSRLPTLQRIAKELLDKDSLNDVVLQMVWDSFYMLVIDLVSFCDQVTRPDGLLNQLRFEPQLLAEVKPDSIPSVVRPARVGEDPDVTDSVSHHYQRMAAAGQNAARQRLLWVEPRGRSFTADDVEAMVEVFELMTQPLRRDRNNGRAHRYTASGATIEKTFLRMTQVEEHIDELVEYLKDVLLVASNQNFGATVRGLGQHDTTAEDIADIICHGSINRACLVYGVTPDRVDGQSRAWYRTKREEYLTNQGISRVPPTLSSAVAETTTLP